MLLKDKVLVRFVIGDCVLHSHLASGHELNAGVLLAVVAAMAGHGDVDMEGAIEPLHARLPLVNLTSREVANFTHAFSASAALASLALHAALVLMDTADTGAK